MSDEQPKASSDADKELEREVRAGRKVSVPEAIGRLAGPGMMKGVSPVPPKQQAQRRGGVGPVGVLLGGEPSPCRGDTKQVAWNLNVSRARSCGHACRYEIAPARLRASNRSLACFCKVRSPL
jgi:hypothetical protein